MIQICAKITYHGAYYHPRSHHLQPCLNIEDSFAFEYGNESLWHGQGNTGGVLSINRWWAWTFLRRVGPCLFAISPCFQKFSYNFCWRVKLFEDLKVKLKELWTLREICYLCTSAKVIRGTRLSGNRQTRIDFCGPQNFAKAVKHSKLWYETPDSLFVPTASKCGESISLPPSESYPLHRYCRKGEPHPDPCWCSGGKLLN